MSYIGIDIGTTNVKIIETDERLEPINKAIFEKDDPNNALNAFLKDNHINMDNVTKIVATGVGINKLDKSIDNIEIVKVPEFIAIAKGGKIILKDEDYIVASVGTGTAFIENKKGEISHLGGTGVGGGALINLCKRIIPEISFEEIDEITKNTSLEKIDLWIKDVTDEEIKTLPKNITAVNLGKLNEKSTKEEMVLGVVNMVFETIGVMAALASKKDSIKNILVFGQLANLPFAKEVFNKVEVLHNVKFIIPQNPEYMVALGAIYSVEKL